MQDQKYQLDLRWKCPFERDVKRINIHGISHFEAYGLMYELPNFACKFSPFFPPAPKIIRSEITEITEIKR